MKVLAVFAHPDDEVLWGWPVLQDPANERVVVTVSDNHGPDRPSTAEALYALGRREGWDTCCLHLPAEFYRLPTRRAEDTLPARAHEVRRKLLELADHYRPDAVFTHNPLGEYGHGDHRLTFELVATTLDEQLPVLFTNVCMTSECHVGYAGVPPRFARWFTDRVADAELDASWFTRCRALYEWHRAWTWSHDLVVQAGVYRA